jgi:hypothetical protein
MEEKKNILKFRRIMLKGRPRRKVEFINPNEDAFYIYKIKEGKWYYFKEGNIYYKEKYTAMDKGLKNRYIVDILMRYRLV